MKKIIMLFTFIALSSCASLNLNPVPDNEVTIDKVIENLTEKKDDLYVKANAWMVDAFNNAESVIQFSDKEAGVFKGKYLMMGSLGSGLYGTTIDTRIYFTITVNVQDNRAKINIKPTKSISANAKMKEIIIADLDKLVVSFMNAMKSEKKTW